MSKLLEVIDKELLWDRITVLENALILSIDDTKICQNYEGAQLGASIWVKSRKVAFDYYLERAKSLTAKTDDGSQLLESIAQEMKRKDEIIVKDNRHINNLDKENEANKQRVAVLEQEILNLKKQVEGSHKNQTELVNGATHHLAKKDHRIAVLERVLNGYAYNYCPIGGFDCKRNMTCDNCREKELEKRVQQAESEIENEQG